MGGIRGEGAAGGAGAAGGMGSAARRAVAVVAATTVVVAAATTTVAGTGTTAGGRRTAGCEEAGTGVSEENLGVRAWGSGTRVTERTGGRRGREQATQMTEEAWLTKLAQLRATRQWFDLFASVDRGGQRFMTMRDVLRALTLFKDAEALETVSTRRWRAQRVASI